MNDKQGDHLLPAPAPASAPPRPGMSLAKKVLIGVLATLFIGTQTHTSWTRHVVQTNSLPTFVASTTSASAACSQVAAILPSPEDMDSRVVWAAKDRIIKWHQDSVRIATEVFDEMGAPGDDPRWEVFEKFHRHLADAYPLAHAAMTKTTVDTWGLIYEWIGSDPSLKPLFLTGHQDVVPVLKETEYLWEHPPFSGDYDGTYIWGRGSSDDKSSVTGIMAAIELLLERGKFEPKRTIVLGFGHDEERGGMRGAPAIRDWILAKYGKDSMAMLVDESSHGIETQWGQTFGLPAVAEKGKFDLNMTVSTRGGHSSIPPAHTGIGLTSLLVATLERHPHEPRLEKTSPIWGFLQCAADYASDMPKDLKKAVKKSNAGDKKAFKHLPRKLIEAMPGRAGPGQGNIVEALMTTTQAADIIYGGAKINALPEVVSTFVNYRIDVGSSVAELQQRIFDTLLPTAKEFDLALVGFGRSFKPKHTAVGTVTLDTPDWGEDLEPAPISPTNVESPAWRMLAGTARAIWASRADVSPDGTVANLSSTDDLIMAPYMMTGNTDTRRYWDLTGNIYRFRYISDTESQGPHTINERVAADAMVEFTRFFMALILNVDANAEL